jgi:hypothetical protein
MTWTPIAFECRVGDIIMDKLKKSQTIVACGRRPRPLGDKRGLCQQILATFLKVRASCEELDPLRLRFIASGFGSLVSLPLREASNIVMRLCCINIPWITHWIIPLKPLCPGLRFRFFNRRTLRGIRDLLVSPILNMLRWLAGCWICGDFPSVKHRGQYNVSRRDFRCQTDL